MILCIFFLFDLPDGSLKWNFMTLCVQSVTVSLFLESTPTPSL